MSAESYQQLKFKGHVYSVGDNILLRENNGKLLISKLLEIIPTGGIPTYEEWPCVKVQWYYHPSDLDLCSLGILEADQIHLADNELFYSDHTDIVYIGSIIGKCDVFSIEEYDQCETSYIHITRDFRLDPPFNKWKTLCSCNKPMNPNMLTIGCDRCSKWFHPHCEGILPEHVKDVEYFVCSNCKNRPYYHNSK